MAEGQEAAEIAEVAPLKEGNRWRYTKPDSAEVKGWFDVQPLDEGMEHDDYIGGVVLIGASEKVKVTAESPSGKKTVEEIWEQTYTPYVRIDMRVLYFKRLAEKRDLIRVIEPVEVPRISDPGSSYFNAQMATGFWWHIVADSQGKTVRYLVSTHRVALYEKKPWLAATKEEREQLAPLLEGIGSKQVNGGPDANAIMKAESGAIGRALGVAGILVVGTGIATAEDMQEALSGPQAAAAATIPEGGPGAPQTVALTPEAQLADLRRQAVGYEAEIKATSTEAWHEFTAWWKERSSAENWATLLDVPVDPLRGVVSKMERTLDTARRTPTRETPDVQDEAAGNDAETGTGPAA
jgi:hypothetical protein